MKKSISSLAKRINNLGRQLVTCNANCPGICNTPRQGIIPRCLYLETDNRDQDAAGCVIVGINPGRGKKGNHERKYYQKLFNQPNGITYQGVFDYWDNPSTGKGKYHKYYNDLRALVNGLGYNGPILWTEIVKCETHDNALPPVDTIRTCAYKYLLPELEAVPSDWQIIAVGKAPFDLLKYVVVERSVLGIPHPGSWGDFKNLFVRRKVLASSVKKRIKQEVNRLKKATKSAARIR